MTNGRDVSPKRPKLRGLRTACTLGSRSSHRPNPTVDGTRPSRGWEKLPPARIRNNSPVGYYDVGIFFSASMKAAGPPGM